MNKRQRKKAAKKPIIVLLWPCERGIAGYYRGVPIYFDKALSVSGNKESKYE